MRVSDAMFNRSVAQNIDLRRTETVEAQQAASTGVKVAEPSDDPVAAARARGLRSQEERAQTVVELSDEGASDLLALDSVLNDVGGVLSRVKELSVLGASDGVSTNERATLAGEVADLRQQLLALANAKIQGRYALGGLAHGAPPFDASGAFVGSTEVMEIDVGPGVRLPIQLAGASVFSGGGVDTFGTLTALENALNANDRDGVRALLDDLDGSIGQVADQRGLVGNRVQSLRMASAAAARVRDDAMGRHATLVEGDPFETFSDLVRAENALRQALAMAARMQQMPSLLDASGF